MIISYTSAEVTGSNLTSNVIISYTSADFIFLRFCRSHGFKSNQWLYFLTFLHKKSWVQISPVTRLFLTFQQTLFSYVSAEVIGSNLTSDFIFYISAEVTGSNLTSDFIFLRFCRRSHGFKSHQWHDYFLHFSRGHGFKSNQWLYFLTFLQRRSWVKSLDLVLPTCSSDPVACSRL